MPKKAQELGDAAVRRLRHGFIKGVVDTDSNDKRYRKKDVGEPCPAYHAVGGVAGLVLCCLPPRGDGEIGPRSWVLRVSIGGKRRELGLGGYPDVTLAQARSKAREIKEKIANGIDPLAERKAARDKLRALQVKGDTFQDIATKYMARKVLGYKESTRLRQHQKMQTLFNNYVFPHIGDMPPAEIETRNILEVLEPIWTDKHPTAVRVRIHLEAVLSMAKVLAPKADQAKFGDNPAKWEHLKNTTLARSDAVHTTEHHKALEVARVPEFMSKLVEKGDTAHKALAFSILTASRPSEARGARWEEIDFDRKVWVVPAERMKGRKRHTVPLSTHMIDLLMSIGPEEQGFVFMGLNGKEISASSMNRVPKRLGYDVTLHGFRSAFIDWTRQPSAFNHVAYDTDHAELCAAHVNSSSTRAAYARDEVVEERRPIMQDWSDFIFNQ